MLFKFCKFNAAKLQNTISKADFNILKGEKTFSMTETGQTIDGHKAAFGRHWWE